MTKYILLIISFVLGPFLLQAQPERVGQAGAMELLFNTAPRSSGLNGLDIASSDGIESAFVNPAGVARTTGTELVFSHTLWLRGSDIRVNTFGFSQSLGEGSASLGVTVNALSLGDFVRTTTAQPDGTLGNFSPSFLNVGFSFAKKFTDRIYVGATVRVISESTPEVSAAGVAFDAGIQYRSGKKDRLKLGIALKNVGPTMQFTGDGLAGRVIFQTNNAFTSTVTLPTSSFELPTVLNMGGSYDFFIGTSNTITITAGFMSHSFFYDQGGLGLSYKYKDYLILRGSFLYQEGIFGEVVGINGRFDSHTGASAGATFQVPFNTGKRDASGNETFSPLSIDVSYRTTNPFDGTFVFGARIDI